MRRGRGGIGTAIGAIGATLLAASAQAGAPRCEGRFVLTSVSPPLPAEWSLAAAIVVEGRKVAIDDVCDTTRGRIRTRPEGERVRVGFTRWRWVLGGGDFVGAIRDFYGGGPRLVPESRCVGTKGVKLEAWIAPDCATMTGRIRARAPVLDVTFTAVPE